MAKPMDIVNEYIIWMITIIGSTLNVNICTRHLANYLKVNLIKILLQLLCNALAMISLNNIYLLNIYQLVKFSTRVDF